MSKEDRLIFPESHLKFEPTSFAEARTSLKVVSQGELQYAKARDLLIGEIVPAEESKRCCVSKCCH
jgi:hypothetical protein